MKNKQFIQILKFTLFSLSAGIIQIAMFELMYSLIHINYWISYLTSLILSVLWNFTFNRKFTFKSSNNIPLSMLLVFVYYVFFTPLSTWWGHSMESVGVNGTVVTLISMLINFVTEFLYQKFVVFKPYKRNATVKTNQDESINKVPNTKVDNNQSEDLQDLSNNSVK